MNFGPEILTGNGGVGAEVVASARLEQQSHRAGRVGPGDVESLALGNIVGAVGEDGQGKDLGKAGRNGEETSRELHFGGVLFEMDVFVD